MNTPLELADRPIRFPAAATSALTIAREELRRLYADSDRQIDGLLVELARTRFYLGRILSEAQNDSLPLTQEAIETLAAHLDQTLNEWSVRLDDRTGQLWESDWTKVLSLRGHRRNDELPHAVVAFVETPIIWRGSRLLSKGTAALEGPQPN